MVLDDRLRLGSTVARRVYATTPQAQGPVAAARARPGERGRCVPPRRAAPGIAAPRAGAGSGPAAGPFPGGYDGPRRDVAVAPTRVAGRRGPLRRLPGSLSARG